MGVQNEKEKLENLKRRTRMKRSEKKKKQPRRKRGKKPSIKLSIPSRRGKKKK